MPDPVVRDETAADASVWSRGTRRLPPIHYRARVGTFDSFRRAMLDAVANSNLLPGDIPNPFLNWRPSAAGDYHTALIELWAYLADILIFYQERIANEAYLPTATHVDSLLRHAKLIAYRPGPVTAARSTVAFTFGADRVVVVPPGLRVGSKPPPGQPAAVFETEAALVAYGPLSAMPIKGTFTTNQFAPAPALALVGGRAHLVPTVSFATRGAARISMPTTSALIRAAESLYGVSSGAVVAETLPAVSIVAPPEVQADFVPVSGAASPGAFTVAVSNAGPTIAVGDHPHVTGTATVSWSSRDQFTRTLHLRGSLLRLNVGDPLLLVENEGQPVGSAHPERATVRWIETVTLDPTINTTTVTWIEDPAFVYDTSASRPVSVNALRVAALPFGAVAPNWYALSPALKEGVPDAAGHVVPGPYACQNWDDQIDLLDPSPYLQTSQNPATVYLDGVYPDITGPPGQTAWAVLTTDTRRWRFQLDSVGVMAGREPASIWQGAFSDPGQPELLSLSSDGTWQRGSLADDRGRGARLSWESLAVTAEGSAGTAGPTRFLFVAAGRFEGASRAELQGYTEEGWWQGTISTDQGPAQLTFVPQASNAQALAGPAGDTSWAARFAAAETRQGWTGDFTGAGQDELLMYFAEAGEWWRGTLTATQLEWTRIEQTAGPTRFLFVAAGRFGGAETAELLVWAGDAWWRGTVSVYQDQLQLAFVAQASNATARGGSDGQLSWAGRFAAAETRQGWTGDFTGAGQDELLMYFAEAGEWWRGTLTATQLEWTRVGHTPGVGPRPGSPAVAGPVAAGPAQLLFASSASNWSLGTLVPSAEQQVFRVTREQVVGTTAYAMSARVTRLAVEPLSAGTPDAALASFTVRGTVILAGSERLETYDDVPLPPAMAGGVLLLDRRYPELHDGRDVIVQAKAYDLATRQQLETTVAHLTVVTGEPQWDEANQYTKVRVATPLPQVVSRPTAQVLANIVNVTQGETVKDEILGSGDGSAFQVYPLQRTPLTYLRIAGSDGQVELQSTLTVFVNGVPWTEVASLGESDASAQEFETTVDEAGGTMVVFGDGVNGARPPTGANNVVATYRVGGGPAGNLDPGSIAQTIDTVPGLLRVTNPVPSTGGTESPATSPDQLRAATAVHVQTRIRIVSLVDYVAAALGVPDVGKAGAVLRVAPESTNTFVELAIAPADGKPLTEHPGLASTVKTSLDVRRDTNVGLQVVGVAPVHLDVAAIVAVADGFPRQATLGAAESALNDGRVGYFAFERRQLGQVITVAALQSTLLAVEGVAGVRITRLRRVGDPDPAPYDVVLGPIELATIGTLSITLGEGGYVE